MKRTDLLATLMKLETGINLLQQQAERSLQWVIDSGSVVASRYYQDIRDVVLQTKHPLVEIFDLIIINEVLQRETWYGPVSIVRMVDIFNAYVIYSDWTVIDVFFQNLEQAINAGLLVIDTDYMTVRLSDFAREQRVKRGWRLWKQATRPAAIIHTDYIMEQLQLLVRPGDHQLLADVGGHILNRHLTDNADDSTNYGADHSLVNNSRHLKANSLLKCQAKINQSLRQHEQLVVDEQSATISFPVKQQLTSIGLFILKILWPESAHGFTTLTLGELLQQAVADLSLSYSAPNFKFIFNTIKHLFNLEILTLGQHCDVLVTEYGAEVVGAGYQLLTSVVPASQPPSYQVTVAESSVVSQHNPLPPRPRYTSRPLISSLRGDSQQSRYISWQLTTNQTPSYQR